MDRLKHHYSETKELIGKKKPGMKKFLFGMKNNDGFIYKLCVYFILIVFSFVFLYPLIYMISISLMSNIDLVDNTVQWIPSKLYTFNYKMTWKALNLPNSYFTTALLAGLSMLCVAVSSGVIGYGLARFDFRGKKLVLVLMLFTFIVPKTLFFIPRFQIYSALGLKGNLGAILIPALTGQGEQAALFILIFYQFFKMIPKSLEEAAFIDGAGPFKTFIKIAVPMAGPALIIVCLYSFSLYWNETFSTSLYLDGKIKTVPMLLGNLQNNFGQVISQSVKGDASVNPNLNFTEAKIFAGTILSIIPLAALYLFIQRWFVESIDKTGITGE